MEKMFCQMHNSFSALTFCRALKSLSLSWARWCQPFGSRFDKVIVIFTAHFTQSYGCCELGILSQQWWCYDHLHHPVTLMTCPHTPDVTPTGDVPCVLTAKVRPGVWCDQRSG